MEEENKEKEGHKDVLNQVKEKTEDLIEQLLQNEIEQNEIEILGKLIDIHKDISNEEYWKVKESDNMRYGMNYGNYGNYSNGGSYGNNYGNYGNYNGRGAGYDSYGNNYVDGSYGRRGRDAKYRGDDHLNRMYEDYGRYEESRQRYGAGEDTKKSLEYMLHSMEDFAKMLKDEAQSQEEVMMIKETAQRIASM